MKKSASSATTMYQVHKQAHSPPLRRLCLQPGWSSALIQQGVVQSVPLVDELCPSGPTGSLKLYRASPSILLPPMRAVRPRRPSDGCHSSRQTGFWQCTETRASRRRTKSNEAGHARRIWWLIVRESDRHGPARASNKQHRLSMLQRCRSSSGSGAARL